MHSTDKTGRNRIAIIGPQGYGQNGNQPLDLRPQGLPEPGDTGATMIRIFAGQNDAGGKLPPGQGQERAHSPAE